MSANKVNIAPATDETLKKLDWIIVVDHSGSTSNPSTRIHGGSLYDEMREQAQLAANIAEKYDDDGITVIHFASHVVVRDGVKAQEMRNVFAEQHPGGSTRLDLALAEAVKKAKSSTKEVVVIVYTDGEADNYDDVINVMNQAGRDLGRPRIGFCFVQVGNDPAAKKFLDRLDNEMKIDVCATFNSDEAGDLSIEQLVNAARTE